MYRFGCNLAKIFIHSTPEEEIEQYKETPRKILGVMTHFIKYADNLTAEYVGWKHWKLDTRSR
jgi:hypothetical protein